MERQLIFIVFVVGLVAAALGAILGVTAYRHGYIDQALVSSSSPSIPANVNSETVAPPVSVQTLTNLPTLAPVLKAALPAVVNIAASGNMNVESNPLFNDPFFRHFLQPFGIPFDNNSDHPTTQHTQSIGSGVIVDAEKGYVLTNQHLVNKADDIYVVLQDKRKIKAKVVGSDPDTDIALLQIKEDHLTALPLGDSSTLHVGDYVMAIGNPFGLGNTSTFGIVSALGRTGLGIEGYENFIQTDASINPGNSGGALINLQGQLVGINTAILSGGGGNVGIGFAIPINMVREVMDELIAHGKVSHGRLGVEVQDVTPDLKAALGLQVDSGAVIAKVIPDSPAAKAGIEQGDVITSLDNQKVTSASDLRIMVGLKSIGDKVEIGLIRKGEQKSVTVVIGKPETEGQSEIQGVDLLKGATFSAIEPGNPAYGKTQGVIVAKVDPESPAASAELQEGDIVLSVNQQPVTNVDELTKAAKLHKDNLLLNVQRGDMALFIVIR